MKQRFASRLLVISLYALTGLTTLVQADETKPLVFAASSLRNALEEITNHHIADIGEAPNFSYVSSGTLARQIASGAPADIFISANKEWTDWLENNAAERVQIRKPLVYNQLALIKNINHKSEIQSVTDLAKNLGDSYIAIGNPAHVPAGIYAKQSLQALGIWDHLNGKLSFSSNVRAALFLVQQNAASFGIVYQSDLYENTQVELLEVLPAETHNVIEYHAILLKQEDKVNQQAQKLFKFISSDSVKDIWEKHGFQVNLTSPNQP